MSTQAKEMIGSILAIIVIAIITTVFLYTQRYVKINVDTAEKGIIFTRTIDLNKYQVIGSGSGLFGEYTLVTRSMTQGKDEATSIYEK